MNAIVVEDLSKRYVIGHQSRKDTLRDTLASGMQSIVRRLHGQWGGAAKDEEFWALRNVSFVVPAGEVLGVIGRNGAGKSTLLKLLSRITEPTTGRIRLRGRVASLLEVGTGFHPELTGRENVFLNGAILGMSHREIRRKFDEIVAFAEVERFLDTPVKRYSSGMYVRLAFAVAAHLDPEILIIDEVLAVGDAAFQKKCLGKMRQVATLNGRTVIFVSHNIQAVRQLCSRAILLSSGQLVHEGTPAAVAGEYLGATAKAAADLSLDTAPRGTKPDGARFRSLQFRDESDAPLTRCERSREIRITISVDLEASVSEFDMAIAITLPDGTHLCSEVLSDHFPQRALEQGSYECHVTVPAKFLKVGSHSMTVAALQQGRVLDMVEALPLPDIIDSASDAHIESHRWGLFRLPVAWRPMRRLP